MGCELGCLRGGPMGCELGEARLQRRLGATRLTLLAEHLVQLLLEAHDLDRGVRVYVYIVYGCSDVYCTSTAPPLPVSRCVSCIRLYVYVLYTYTKICDHVCTMYAFYTAKIHQKQGIFLMYATENDVYIKLLYARVYVARQHRGSCRGSYRG